MELPVMALKSATTTDFRLRVYRSNTARSLVTAAYHHPVDVATYNLNVKRIAHD